MAVTLLSSEVQQKIKELSDKGWVASQIMKELGVSRDSVQKYRHKKASTKTLDDVLGEVQGDKPQHLVNVTYAPKSDERGRLILKTCPDVVLILPDLQFPFAHPDCFNFLSMVAQRYKPDCVVGIGDEVDNNFMSAYEREPDLMSGSMEYERAMEQVDRLFKLFPEGYGLHSNHGRGRISGAWKRAGLPSVFAPDYHGFLKAPKGWAWYDEVRLGDVLFHHGDGEKALTQPYLLKHVPADYGRHYSVVHGHRHEMIGRQANITIGDNEYWAAYTGCLINPYSKAYSYTKGRKAKLGCGLIVHGEYKQIRMKLDEAGRWIGEL